MLRRKDHGVTIVVAEFRPHPKAFVVVGKLRGEITASVKVIANIYTNASPALIVAAAPPEDKRSSNFEMPDFNIAIHRLWTTTLRKG